MEKNAFKYEMTDTGELNFWGVIEYIVAGWYWLIGGASLGLLAALVWFTFSSEHYEATALVKPATVAILFSNSAEATKTAGMPISGVPIEPSGQTVERLKFATFYNEKIVKTCQVDSSKYISNNVRASVIKGENLISLSYRGSSASLASTCLNAIVDQLAQLQKNISTPFINVIEAQRESIKKQIDHTEQLVARIESHTPSSLSVSESLLLALHLENLATLKRSYDEKGIYLIPPFTQPLQLLEPVNSPKSPISQKKPVTIIWGLVFGAFVGLGGRMVYFSRERYSLKLRRLKTSQFTDSEHSV